MTFAAEGLLTRRLAQAQLGQLSVYPSNAGAAGPVTSPNTDWGLGAFATLIPAGTISFPFYIAGLRAYDNIAAQTGAHEIELYYGASDVNFGNWKFFLDPANGILFDTNEIRMGQPGGDPIPGGSQVRAKIAYSLGLTVGVSAVLFDLYYKQVLG